MCITYNESVFNTVLFIFLFARTQLCHYSVIPYVSSSIVITLSLYISITITSSDYKDYFILPHVLNLQLIHTHTHTTDRPKD